jgi:GT2 family glycosyltransferase
VNPTKVEHPGAVANSTAAVVLTYGARQHFVEAAVRGALAAGVAHAIVVSNGCSDAVRDELDRRLAIVDTRRCTHIPLPRNLGSAGGYHVGMEHALRNPQIGFLWLLDDDNVPDADALHALDRAWALVDQAAPCVALMSLRPDRPYVANYAREVPPREVRPSSFMSFNVLHYVRRMNLRKHDKYCGFPVVPHGPYGGLLISAELVRTIGFPADEFILYADDTEYTIRIARHGGKLLLVPQSRIDDLEPTGMAGASSWTWFGQRAWLTMPADRAYYSLRNEVYLERHYLCRNRLLFVLNALCVCTAVVGAGIAGRRFRRLSLLARALRDGWVGHLGPAPPRVTRTFS